MTSNSLDYTERLRELMHLQGIASFKQLSDRAKVSEKQLRHLRRGHIQQVRLETLIKLSHGLGISIAELMSQFELIEPEPLQQEYQRLQTRLEEQRQELWQEFQQASLQTLESWLLQWPTAAYAAQNNPQAPAVKLLPLLKPVEQLLQDWGIEAIATIGSEIPYDPQQHQLMDGTAAAGDPVRVRYTGYRQGDRLLYRTKVSPVIPS
jgi:transcriptional regulator with XRE-family HTH domain